MTQNPTATKPASSFRLRQEKIAALLPALGVQALALNPGPSLVYLTGLHFHLSERPVVALVAPGQPLTLVLPELELGKASGLPYDVRPFPYGEDPAAWGSVFKAAIESHGPGLKKIGVEPIQLRLLELNLLQAARPGLQVQSAEAELAALRMCKDETELASMRTAAKIAQAALLATLPAIKAGASERGIAAELVLQLLRLGSDPSLPFPPIVSSGPNSANPHAVPSDRALKPGDLLVIDWGAAYQGYFSDITRTFAIGKVEPEFERISQIVQNANAAGRAACAPDILAEEVDGAARDVIAQAGYGAQFFHRTGHGLGMEVHEAPYIRAGNRLVLKPGMTFTIEPGIYLEGRGGVRIEDDVVITEKGSESLTDLPREVQRMD